MNYADVYVDTLPSPSINEVCLVIVMLFKNILDLSSICWWPNKELKQAIFHVRSSHLVFPIPNMYLQ